MSEALLILTGFRLSNRISIIKINMKLKFCLKVLILLANTFTCFSQNTLPKSFGPIPTENQLRWQQIEYYAFVHYSINTYTDMAWGLGNEDPQLFNPDKLDCRQWARICKEAGMKGIIFTAKHHCIFLRK
jgi:alpha-L-fucosidase